MNGYNILETVSGTIENVIYSNENNDYTVLEISTEENELITCVGTIPMAFEGERVVLKGNYTYHKEFGKQFAFESFEKTLPREVDGILQYLSSGTVKGVGPVTALKIVNKFGAETFDVMENHPEWLSDIPGITMKKAATICESFREQSDIRGVMMFCKDYLGTGEVTKVYKGLGAGAVGIIKENPYVLCNEDYGIPFPKVDEIAKSLDISPSAPVRVLHGIKYVLSYNASVNGHTCLPKDKLVEASSVLLEIDTECVRERMENFIRDGELSTYKLEDALLIMTNTVYEAEKNIAKRLSLMCGDVIRYSAGDVRALLEKLEGRLGIEYAMMQKEAIYEALNSGAMVLTGGPGTGKTTIVKALISIFDSFNIKYALAAPTGRAAKRMSEATGKDAKTIHRMLEMEHNVGCAVRFGRDETNPLDEQAVIIDEASMIDLMLMDALVNAMKRGSRLILIGDSDQLPSVGAGNIFADIIESECIKTVRLTEIFRQSGESLIITNAHKINAGEPPILTSTDNDFFFVRRENERDIAETVSSLVLERLPRRYGDFIKDQIQIITPSKKGSGGVEVLNSVLQAKLNPKSQFKREKSAHGITFREGDKVMQTANNYDLTWEKDGVEGSGIFNGDIGVIQDIDNAKSKMKICFDDRVVDYDFELLDELELAYSITVHKSQGSEYPIVIVPMYYCAPMLMTRNLFYTAVTRARRMVILVGRSDIPRKMVENNRQILRYTTLKNRIRDYFI